LFSAWKVPSRPVMPETHSFVFVSTRTLIGQAPRPSRPPRSWSGRRARWQRGVLQDPAALDVVRAVQADDERHARLELGEGLDQAVATSSQRVMPPKMFSSTALTAGLERISSIAW
jgi:hypothetical protein